jgi:hypothetical protein
MCRLEHVWRIRWGMSERCIQRAAAMSNADLIRGIEIEAAEILAASAVLSERRTTVQRNPW